MDYSNYIEHYKKDAETYQYQQPFDSVAGQVSRRRAEFILRLLDKRLLLPGAHIVDIGTGGGEQIRELMKKGLSPIGLDIAIRNLQTISETLPRENKDSFHLICGDAYALPFKDASLDCLIFSEVFEHLGRPGDALQEAARVLKPDGKLIISVPYKEKIVYHLCIHCNRLTPSNAHLHSFDKNTMRDLLQNLPLSIESEKFFHNKILNMMGCIYTLRHFPYRLWRVVDGLANALFKKPYYYTLIIRKQLNQPPS